MIIWSIKLLSNVRKAIAGRQYPHQLAWAVALGVLLGIIPHGNLVALAVLVVVLSVRINHAMAALTAIGVSFSATKLDPYSHQIGEYVLSHEALAPHLANAWGLPLMPWTEMNNTVVMGSFLIGVAALLPIFIITYPFFRLFKPKPIEELDSPAPVTESASKSGKEKVVVVDGGHQRVSGPHRVPSQAPSAPSAADFHPADSHSSQAVETRIDVIRMKDSPVAETPTTEQPTDSMDTTSESNTDTELNEQQPMDEALNYLLRQLRTSQQKDAA
ncbi:hypothetical protein CA13_49670 [Planctomycetes bacterium CA13]|uniref:DUF2062 domain-containing protein n=1 Tax=Novipirellula herctigrandis TaxID=2527986 RepID=A0A5C5Z879_9BACT|nr:hypothetical protein CA13_49670 [Planctomycetes bacterium CA13]